MTRATWLTSVSTVQLSRRCMKLRLITEPLKEVLIASCILKFQSLESMEGTGLSVKNLNQLRSINNIKNN